MTRSDFLTLAERYLKRNDLADLYSTWLLMAEARINQVARLSEMEARSISAPKAAFWALPDDFIEMRHIQAQLARGPQPLEYVPPETADNYRRNADGLGFRWFTLVDNQLEIIPHPNDDSDTAVEMFYYAKLQPLVAQADTNSVLTNYPNLYLYAFLAEAALYREDSTAMQTHLAAFDGYINQLNTSAQAGRYGGNALQLRAI